VCTCMWHPFWPCKAVIKRSQTRERVCDDCALMPTHKNMGRDAELKNLIDQEL
jgi:hypothetical protein